MLNPEKISSPLEKGENIDKLHQSLLGSTFVLGGGHVFEECLKMFDVQVAY